MRFSGKRNRAPSNKMTAVFTAAMRLRSRWSLVLSRSRFLSSALNVFLRRLLGLLAGLLFAALTRLLSCIQWVALSRLRARLLIANVFCVFRHGRYSFRHYDAHPIEMGTQQVEVL